MRNVTKHQREEAKACLEDAKTALWIAIDQISQYVRITGDSHAEAYVEQQLRTHVEGGGMVSHNTTIEDLMEQIDGEDEDEDEADYEANFGCDGLCLSCENYDECTDYTIKQEKA